METIDISKIDLNLLEFVAKGGSFEVGQKVKCIGFCQESIDEEDIVKYALGMFEINPNECITCEFDEFSVYADRVLINDKSWGDIWRTLNIKRLELEIASSHIAHNTVSLLCNRGGLDSAWDSIDDLIQEEIIRELEKIAYKELLVLNQSSMFNSYGRIS